MTGSFAKLLIAGLLGLAACTSPEELEREAGVEDGGTATDATAGEGAGAGDVATAREKPIFTPFRSPIPRHSARSPR